MKYEEDSIPVENLGNTLSEVVRESAKIICNKLDNLVLEVLKEKGHSFENKVDFAEFLKERCHIVKHPCKQEKMLFLDEEPVLRWEEGPNMNLEDIDTKTYSVHLKIWKL